MSEREFEAYLNLLARTLKLSEPQRQQIAGELRDHLEERMADLIDQGHDREAAILAALDEFGDANVLAHDLTQPRKQRFRKKLMQSSFATIAAAALIALGVTYFTPNNYQGTPTQPPALAANNAPESPDNLESPDASASNHDENTEKPSAAGFIYLMGQTQRPGAYTIPEDQTLSLMQLIASAGGLGNLTGNYGDEAIRLRIVRRQDDQTESVTTLTYAELKSLEKPFFLQADDLIEVQAEVPANKLDLDFKDTPFAEVVNFFRHETGANYHVNWEQLGGMGIHFDTPVTAQLKSIDPSAAWSLILDSLPNTLRSDYRPVAQEKYGVILLTSERVDADHQWAGGFVRRTYDATALIDLYRQAAAEGDALSLDQADQKLQAFLSQAVGQVATRGSVFPDLQTDRYTIAVYGGVVTINQPREIADQIAAVLIETERILRRELAKQR